MEELKDFLKFMFFYLKQGFKIGLNEELLNFLSIFKIMMDHYIKK